MGRKSADSIAMGRGPMGATGAMTARIMENIVMVILCGYCGSVSPTNAVQIATCWPG
jgi:ferredoxin